MGTGLSEETHNMLGSTFVVLPLGAGASYTPLGGMSGPTLPHRETKVSRAGSPSLEPRSSLDTPARCEWLSKVWVPIAVCV